VSGHRYRLMSVVGSILATAALVACGGSSSQGSGGGSGSGSTGSTSGKPLNIGISLSLSGDFSDPGKAAKRGYELWADTVNAKGGVMGRKVALHIVDDASSPNQVVTNYQNLITRDKVDLVFGPFSTLLTAPAAQVVNRYGYAFPEPAGGGPAVFKEKLGNVFFVQPAPTINCGDPFVRWVLSLPAAQRPKTAAYPTLDDPFAAPIVDRARQQLEAAGVKTVFKTVYPPETADLTPIVQKYANANPDLVFGGVQSEDAYSQVKAMVQMKFSPKFVFFSNAANSPTEFPDKVGANNTEGVMSCGDWFSDIKTAGNAEFVKAYVAKYGGTADQIDSGSAEAYAVGQLIELVAQRTHKLDNKTIISSLHSGSWPVIEGSLSWNADGSPKGSVVLAQWQKRKLLPVYPPAEALATPTTPKPNWGTK
jgi:branched-chain amino acid transport system substrate-binding protein